MDGSVSPDTLTTLIWASFAQDRCFYEGTEDEWCGQVIDRETIVKTASDRKLKVSKDQLYSIFDGIDTDEDGLVFYWELESWAYLVSGDNWGWWWSWALVALNLCFYVHLWSEQLWLH